MNKKQKLQALLEAVAELKNQVEQSKTKEDVALTYLTTKQACTYLKVCRKTLYKFRMEGKIRYYKPGRKVMYKQTELDAFINSRRL